MTMSREMRTVTRVLTRVIASNTTLRGVTRRMFATRRRDITPVRVGGLLSTLRREREEMRSGYARRHTRYREGITGGTQAARQY